MSTEIALSYVPLMVIAALAVIACLRLASAAIDVQAAAAAAARQASLARTPAGAVAGAHDAAAASLAGRNITCHPYTTTADTTRMAPGGHISATVTCTISLQDLYGLGLPGSVTITRTSRQPVDTYRGAS